MKIKGNKALFFDFLLKNSKIKFDNTIALFLTMMHAKFRINTTSVTYITCNRNLKLYFSFLKRAKIGRKY